MGGSWDWTFLTEVTSLTASWPTRRRSQPPPSSLSPCPTRYTHTTHTETLLKNSPLEHSPLEHSPLEHSPLEHSPLEHSPLEHRPLEHSLLAQMKSRNLKPHLNQKEVTPCFMLSGSVMCPWNISVIWCCVNRLSWSVWCNLAWPYLDPQLIDT